MKRTIVLLAGFIILLLPELLKAQGADKPQYEIVTRRAGVYLGTINIELFPSIAPLATANFDSLVSTQFYDSTAFHRVIPGFVIQGGDPNSISGPISTWGQGNPNQPNVNAEFSVVKHLRGRMGAARDTGINSANSQFYFCVANQPGLDGQYTVYGQVIAGMDIVDTIVNAPRDVNDVPLQKIDMFVTYTGVNDSVPGIPSITGPADQTTGVVPTTVFSWINDVTVVMYVVECSTDSTFATIDLTKNLAGSSTTITPLLPFTTYYWRVKGNNGGHESAYSPVYSFTTGVAAPVHIYPANGDTGISTSPVISWHAVPGATSYELQVYKSPSLVPFYLVFEADSLMDTVQQVTGLLPNFTYYWRVRGYNGTAAGYMSAVWSFKTATATGINSPGDEGSVLLEQVYPNPAQDKITVEMHANRPGTIIISLKSMKGETVYRTSEKTGAKKIVRKIDTSKLASGIYLLVVEMNGEEITRKIEVN